MKLLQLVLMTLNLNSILGFKTIQPVKIPMRYVGDKPWEKDR